MGRGRYSDRMSGLSMGLMGCFGVGTDGSWNCREAILAGLLDQFGVVKGLAHIRPRGRQVLPLQGKHGEVGERVVEIP